MDGLVHVLGNTQGLERRQQAGCWQGTGRVLAGCWQGGKSSQEFRERLCSLSALCALCVVLIILSLGNKKTQEATFFLVVGERTEQTLTM